MIEHQTPTHIMDEQEKACFHRFIRILADTGNIQHAITESGWTDHPAYNHSQDAVDISGVPHDKLHLLVASSVALPAPSENTSMVRAAVSLFKSATASLPPWKNTTNYVMSSASSIPLMTISTSNTTLLPHHNRVPKP
ncbi:hypothetical protein NT6N_02890 [Oceaniferula spumae]|uniref:Uncharacterized protein n=1 Tax=Oceaniferula spumae TaxID=2979115 RepID=A0AAT9FGW7_9BACT